VKQKQRRPLTRHGRIHGAIGEQSVHAGSLASSPIGLIDKSAPVLSIPDYLT
jgi:hypothetical protein